MKLKRFNQLNEKEDFNFNDKLNEDEIVKKMFAQIQKDIDEFIIKGNKIVRKKDKNEKISSIELNGDELKIKIGIEKWFTDMDVHKYFIYDEYKIKSKLGKEFFNKVYDYLQDKAGLGLAKYFEKFKYFK